MRVGERMAGVVAASGSLILGLIWVCTHVGLELCCSCRPGGEPWGLNVCWDKNGFNFGSLLSLRYSWALSGFVQKLAGDTSLELIACPYKVPVQEH